MAVLHLSPIFLLGRMDLAKAEIPERNGNTQGFLMPRLRNGTRLLLPPATGQNRLDGLAQSQAVESVLSSLGGHGKGVDAGDGKHWGQQCKSPLILSDPLSTW